MDKDLKKILQDGALELGVTVGIEALEMFSKYLNELKAWGRKINLTAITTDRDIVIKHFLDSLTLCRFLSDAGQARSRLLDIGSGAGFPGIPVKIVMPGLKILMMDSVEKKVHFMRHAIRTLGLDGIDAMATRVEDRAVIERYSGQFDFVSSRAFAELGDFVGTALPFCRPGGVILAMKGPAVSKELGKLHGLRGVSAPEIAEVTVPFSDRKMAIVRLIKSSVGA